MTKKRLYYWRGLNQFNQMQQSELIALSLSEAKNQLLRNQIIPLAVRKGPYLCSNQFKTYDLFNITRQLATMLESGLSLISVLTIIIDEQTSPFWRALLKQIINDVNNGHSFSKILHQFPMTFPKIYRQTIAAGENAGQLIYCLQCIVADLEKILNLRNKIKNALRYPILLGSITIIVTMLMLFFVLPQFEQIYANFEADLPWFSHTTIRLANYLQQHIMQIIFIGLLFSVLSYYLIYYKYTCQFQRWLLSIPKLGVALRSHHLYFLFRNLLLTQKAAIPLPDGLKIAEDNTTFIPYNKELNKIYAMIKLGHSFSSTLQEKALFPPICRQCIRTGEESGTLDKMIEKLTHYYQQQTDELIHKLIANIEPLMLLVFCLIVGCLVIALYLPIIHLGEVIL